MSRIQWDIVGYDTSYRAEVLELMELVQGHATTPQEFIWWFENNPTGDLNIYLGLHAGRVIAICCHSTFAMLYRGEERNVSIPLNVLTHPDYRGQGLFSNLEIASERDALEAGSAFMLGFPNKASMPILVKRLGWGRIETERLYFRPLRCERLARRVPVLELIAPAFIPFSALFRGGSDLSKLGLVADRVETFGEWADEIWEANKTTLPICMVRRKEYLNWRFCEDPKKKYSAWLIRKGDTAVGYCVLGSITKQQIHIGYVANSLMLPEYRELGFAIERTFIEHFREIEMDLVLRWHSSWEGPGRPYWKSKYLLLPKRLSFIYKSGSVQVEAREFEDSGNWFLQLGDLDFF